MNDADPFEDELRAGLRSAGRAIAPDGTLPGRVSDRLDARRRRSTMLVLAATAVVLGLGATALALSDDDSPGLITTADSVAPADSEVPDSTPPTLQTVPTSMTSSGPVPAVGAAVNILVVGTDNGACIDSDSPYAPAFGEREGERSDTIMVVRVDPALERASILSFPRDLYLPIHGRGKARINSAFVRDDPDVLIQTIADNFGIGVDHFVQIDFCGFKTIVDAVGGVAVPFDQPVRDTHTGLFVPEPGCFTFTGDLALAYVRSRHYETLVNGQWVRDPSGDLGRIARQQEFMRRTMDAVFGGGLSNAGALRSVIDAIQDSVVVDTGLTISTMLDIAGELRSIGSASIGHYQIEAEPAVVGSSSVLLPRLDGPSM
ncbi:MAG: putative LytR family regulatory protein, partial [Ilumatobacteraceae bacterium]|nr:putative LytR family regulatory protein [Ilumatobacteraceae bacterium]